MTADLFRTRTGTIRNRRPDGRDSNLGLAAAARWPTPRANPAMADRITPSANPDRYPNLETVALKRDPHARGGYLNPRFVEELMGFPLNWTSLEE